MFAMGHRHTQCEMMVNRVVNRVKPVQLISIFNVRSSINIAGVVVEQERFESCILSSNSDFFFTFNC